MFTETNPDKGTETIIACCMLAFIEFTETNPDKGTETSLKELEKNREDSLQKLTPIRGRKRNSMAGGFGASVVYRN